MLRNQSMIRPSKEWGPNSSKTTLWGFRVYFSISRCPQLCLPSSKHCAGACWYFLQLWVGAMTWSLPHFLERCHPPRAWNLECKAVLSCPPDCIQGVQSRNYCNGCSIIKGFLNEDEGEKYPQAYGRV